jgi:hypothetical protein
MSKDKLSTWIPRNLNEEDKIDLGFGIKLTWSNLPLILGGGTMGYLLSTKYNDFLMKTAIILMCVVPPYVFWKIALNEQNPIDVMWNMIIFIRKLLRG